MHAALAAFVLAAGGPSLVGVTATYVPPAKGSGAAVTVQFAPSDPAIHVNVDPAPRLALDVEQQVLDQKPIPAASKKAAPTDAPHYLDAAVPVAFPVALKSGAGAGEHAVKGTVTYFYCSKSEGWCRKGLTDVTFAVRVP